MLLFQDIVNIFTAGKRSKLYLYHIDNPNDILHTLTVDAVLSENVKLRKTLTSYPTEHGEINVDHAYVEPSSITLDCIVSESPATFEDIAYQFNKGDKLNYYIDKTMDFLTFALFPEALLNIDIKLGIFSNLSVTDIQMTSNVDLSGVLSFSMTLEELQVVKSRMVDLPEMLEYNPGPLMEGKGDGKGNLLPTEPTETPKEADPAVVKEKQKTIFANFLKLLVDTMQKFFGG